MASSTITTVAEFEESLRANKENLIKYLNARNFLINDFSFKDIISEDEQGSILTCHDSGKKQKAARMFIDALLRSQDETKWSVFRDILERYESLRLIKDILYEGETISLITHGAEQTLLKLTQGPILEKFEADLMSDQLLEKDFLDTHEYEEVRSILQQKGNINANLHIITMVQQRPGFFRVFLDILWDLEKKNLVKQLDPYYFEKLDIDSPLDDDSCTNNDIPPSTEYLSGYNSLTYASNVQTKDTSYLGESDHRDKTFYSQDEIDQADKNRDEKCFHAGKISSNDDSSCGKFGFSVNDTRSSDASKIRNDSVLTDNLNNLDDGPVSSRTRSKTKLMAEKVFAAELSELEMPGLSKHGPSLVSENKLYLQSDIHDLTFDRSRRPASCQMTVGQQYHSSQTGGLATPNTSPRQEIQNQFCVTSDSDGLTTLNIPTHQIEVQNDTPYYSIEPTDQYQLPQHRERQQSQPIDTEPSNLNTRPYRQPEHEQHQKSSTRSLNKKDTDPLTPVCMNQEREKIKLPTSQHARINQCYVCGKTCVSSDQLRAHQNTNCAAFKSTHRVPQSGDLNQNCHYNQTKQRAEPESTSCIDTTDILKRLKRCSCGRRFTSEDYLKHHQTFNCTDQHSDNYNKSTLHGVRSDQMHHEVEVGSKSLVSTPKNRAERVSPEETEETVSTNNLIKQERRHTIKQSMTRDLSQPHSDSKTTPDLRSNNRGNPSYLTAQQNIKKCKCGKRLVSSDKLKRHQARDCKDCTSSRPSEESPPTAGKRNSVETSQKKQFEVLPSGVHFMETLNQDSLNCICCCGQEFTSEKFMITHRTRNGCAKKLQQKQKAPSLIGTRDTAETILHKEVQDESITQLKQPHKSTQSPAADTQQAITPTSRPTTSNPTLRPAGHDGSREPGTSSTSKEKPTCKEVSGIGFQSRALLKYYQYDDTED